MKSFHLTTETSKPAMGEQYSPVLERVGKYIFWLLVAAVLLARVAYFPVSHPVASNEVYAAKTEIVR
jgi:hypothetical protein